MEYTKLGNTDITVSRICLGCMGFGNPEKGNISWTLDYEKSKEIIAHALELGVNFFDTAIAYNGGTSEQFVGRALRELAKREDVVVATKFLPRTPDEIAAGVTGQQHVENMLNKSLENLGMEYVDLYICHMWDYNTPIEEIMEGMNNVVVSGKARALGFSNCFAWQIAKANAIAEKNGWAKISAVQGHYNLLHREEEREMIPYCNEEGIALTPYSALAAGRLAKRAGEVTKRTQEDGVAKMKYDATAAEDAKIIERVEELADRYGVSMTEISIAWLLTKVTSPVVGATKLHHIDAPASATSLKLTDEDIAYLEEPYVPHALVGVMAINKPKPTQPVTWSMGR